MQRLEVSAAVRPIWRSSCVKGLMFDLRASKIMTMTNNPSNWVRIFSCNLHLEMGGIFWSLCFTIYIKQERTSGKRGVSRSF